MILVKFPSRSRPLKMFAAIENIQSLIGIENYIIALALDLDDESVNNQPVKEKLKEYDNLLTFWGVSRNKIDAVNRSIPMHYGWDILLVVSDDMKFVKQDFGKDIVEAFEQNPDAGLVHFPDGFVQSKFVTLPLMSRKYYEFTGYVYNNIYKSVYADREQTEVAKILGKYVFIDKEIVRHEHYRNGYGSPDELNKEQENQNVYAKDAAVYAQRKSINFGL